MKREYWVLVAVGICVWVLITISLRSARPSGQVPPPDTASTAIDSMTPLERNCYGMWLKYGDTAISNLTVQQSRGIQSCESLGLFRAR
jgi:hypothetical protein